ncbi:MAG: hypothetical protein EBT86_00510 [Actinobacteria bacterium]|nr:hypothetical protein [Actinomycetota bacterium]
MQNMIQDQYNIETSIASNNSPLTLGGNNVKQSPQDYDVVRLLQRQIAVLQQELRRLHARHKELHNEVARLRSQIK